MHDLPKRSSLETLRWIGIGAIAILGCSISTVAQAQMTFNPPSDGAPGNRQPGAVRGTATCFTDPEDQRQLRLAALVPESNVALTTEAYPSFFAYIPPTEASTIEFELFPVESATSIYRVTLPAQPTGGVVQIALPAQEMLPPLTVGELYYWSFTVSCGEGLNRSAVYVEGYTRRIDPQPELSQQLQTVPLSDRPALYANAGIWQDTLTTLADLIRQSTDDTALARYDADWQTLMQTVGLEAIAPYPFR